MTIEIPDDQLLGTKVELPSGKVAFVKECLGLHIAKAQTIMNGDSSMFIPALMFQTVTMEGCTTMEDFLKLKAGDYTKLMSLVTDGLDQSFT